MIVSYVPPEYLDTVWGTAGAMIRQAAEFNGGRYTVRDAYRGISSGNMQLWVIFDDEDEDKKIYGSIVTVITNYPSKKFLTILMVGGSKMHLWMNPLAEVMEKWARDNECNGVEGYGRIGWKKLLKRFGGTTQISIFEKEF